MTRGTGNLGTYATSGIAVTAAQCGLGTMDELIIDPAGGYVFEYVKSTGLVKAYVAGATLPDVIVTGGQAAGPALQITPDTVAGVLGKTTATTVTIPGATFGLSGGSAAAECGVVNLAAITFNFRAIGN